MNKQSDLAKERLLGIGLEAIVYQAATYLLSTKPLQVKAVEGHLSAPAAYIKVLQAVLQAFLKKGTQEAVSPVIQNILMVLEKIQAPEEGSKEHRAAVVLGGLLGALIGTGAAFVIQQRTQAEKSNVSRHPPSQLPDYCASLAHAIEAMLKPAEPGEMSGSKLEPLLKALSLASEAWAASHKQRPLVELKFEPIGIVAIVPASS